MDLERQAGFPGWQPRKGKRPGVQGRAGRQEARGTGPIELERKPEGSGGERGLPCTQPSNAGLLYGYVGFWGLMYLRRQILSLAQFYSFIFLLK